MSDDKRKTELKLEFRREQMKAAREAVPVHPLQARRFFDALRLRLEAEGCDHTQTGAHKIASDLGLSVDDLVDWLDSNGGYCDCEVMSNVYPEWDHMQHSSL